MEKDSERHWDKPRLLSYEEAVTGHKGLHVVGAPPTVTGGRGPLSPATRTLNI